MPPDSERGIDRIFEPGDITDLLKSIQDGETIGLKTGGIYRHHAPWFRADDMTITAVGDRDKPLPILEGRKGAIGVQGARPTWELCQFTSPSGHSGLHFHETSDSILRYVVAHAIGRERTAGLDNHGIAFSTSDSIRGARHDWRHIEAYEIAEDLYQSLRGDGGAEMYLSHIYAHRCYEDGIDNKSLKKLVVRNFWAIECGSKGIVCHGTSGELDVEGFRIERTQLHDGIYIDGKGRTLRGPWTFRNGEIINCKKAAVIFKDASGEVLFENVVRRGNGRDIVLGRNTSSLNAKDVGPFMRQLGGLAGLV